MAETSYPSGIIPSLPVASPPTYLLLIDSRVSNYQDIINAKQAGVYHIIFDAPSRPTTHSKKLIKEVEAKIAELGVPAFTSIGLVQHNDEKPVYEMFGRTSDIIKPRIRAVERTDPDFQSWNNVALFITMLRQNYGIEYFDMMACALYSNPDWKYIIDKLTALTGVTVRASTDDTGAASLGGDWFLESHTGVNLKRMYFTDAIENYNGLLYTAPSAPSTTPTKKLILIDSRIKEVDVIINAMNDETYCLVFNYFYDTPASILSKLRFLNSDNRYILDHFHYETPEIPTQIDASGNHCTPCDDFDITEIQLIPATLQNEYLEYTTSATAATAAADASGNGGVWPFYSESTNITIQKPVFFQRAKLVEPAAEYNRANYKPRPMVLVSELDEFYELGQEVGEIVGGAVAFECVGIIQHTVDPYIGYKFIGAGDDSVSPAIVQDVVSRDSGLSSWVHFTGFIQSLKTAHQTTTLDMMACALYANPDWKYIIDTLAVRENITIRASLDNTGSSANDPDANWVLETDNVSLTTVYFTDKIYAWKYVLATYIDTRFYALRWNDSMYASRAYDARLKIAAGTNNFTIETWYYETTTRFNCTIVDMGSYNYTFHIRNLNVADAKGLSLNNSGIGWNYAESAVVPVAQWSHLAVTRSGSTFTFYVNGIARQTFTSSASLYSNNSTFAIGLQSPDDCSCNKMKLDTVLYDIRLWNVARTANELRMYRNRVVPANSTGLVANYLCTDNGSTFNDRTSNALHTTIQNYSSARWSNTTVPIPNIGFLINNSYSLRTSNSGSALDALTHFDNITHTDFSGVDLSGVNFRGADLTGCNFTNANLTNTNFTNATVLNITTTNATTTGSNLSSAITNMSAGTVLNLDGVDDAVDLGIPSWTNTTPFIATMTVECWFKTADTNNQKSSANFVSRWATGGYTDGAQFMFCMNTSGQIVCYTSNNTATIGLGVTSTLTYKDALWHHAAMTFNGSSGILNLYVDGALVASSTNVNHGNLSSAATGLKLVIGSDHAGVYQSAPDRQFRGSISDVRIWNVVRSASEIADNYRLRLIGNETGLVGYWKLNQGRGSGWGSYSAVMDRTTSRTFGSIFGAGATPSGSWVVSNLKFQPRVGTMTLGANNGVYNFSDSSFSFIDPSSNSLGDFSYSVSPSSVATITNGAATTKTVYSLSAANLVPTYTLYDFPALDDLSGGWQIDISFTVTSSTAVGGSPWRALIGDMYNNVNERGWGLWVSSSNRIHWSWAGATWVGVTAEPVTISVSLNIPYVLTVAQNSGTITLTLRTVSTGATQTGWFSVGANVIGRGPVTVGSWQNYAGEYFHGTISYVNVSVPTNQRVVTISSGTDVGAPATVTAIQASSFDFGSGSKTASLTVNKVAPTINPWSIQPKNFRDASFNLTAPTSDSSGAFTYTNSSNPAVATVALDGTVTIVGAGSTTITASQAASPDGNYTTGSITGVLEVSPINPTINPWTIQPKNFRDASFNLTAPTSDSSGAFTYTNSSHPAVATVALDGTVTIVGAGSTTITASQAASPDGNYSTGSITGVLVVSPIAPTIGALSAPAKNFGDASFNLTAPTSDSSGVFTYDSSNTAVATVSPGGIVNIVGAGSTTITATQEASADGNYNAGSVTAVLVVSPIAPTIGALSVPAKNFRDASFNLTAPTSDSSGAFTYDSSNTAVATVTMVGGVGVVTIVGAGTTTITATQAASADGNYTGGSTVSASLVVSPIAPTIGALSVPAKNFRDISFNLSAPSSDSSGTFTYDSSNTAVATVTSSGLVTIVGAGSTTITATQAASADGNYTGGSSVSGSLVVSAVAPNIGALSVPAKNFGDASFNLTAPTSDSSGAFTYESSNPAVATVELVDGVGVVTVVGAGSTTITATQAASADGNYTGGSTVSASLVVSAIAPTYQSISQITKTYSTDVSFSLLAVMSGVSNSDGSYSFSSPSNAISIADGIATILAYTPSAITITASQDASGNYTASTKTFTLLVNRKTPSYGEFSIPSKTFGDASFSVVPYAPTTDSTEVPFTYTSSDQNVATINSSGSVVTIIGQGYTTITASQEASGNYAANSITTSFLVNRAAPTFLKSFTIPNKTFGDASFSLLPFTDGLDNTDGTYHFTSSNAELVSIDGDIATIHAYTPTPITVYVAIDACGNYASSSTSGTLTVLRAAPTIGALSVPATKNFGDASFNINAPSSNSAGAFTYTSSNTAVATVSEHDVGGFATVTVVGAGSTTITATQAINGNYTSGSVTASLVVSSIAPTIGALSVPAKNFRDASFNLTAPTSDSSGAFTYTSSNTAVATVTSDGTVTVVSAGSTTITATQAASADGNYTGGSTVSASLVVSPIAPTIGSLSVPAKNFRDASFNLTAPTSDSSGAFTYTSSNTAVATVTSDGTVTVVGAGTATITATQAASADGNYEGGSSVSASLVVSPIAPTIGALSVPAKNFGDASFNLTAPTTDSSGSFSYSSSNPAVATVSLVGGIGVVTVVGAGTATITATQAASADGNYTGGSSVTASLVVSPIAPTIGAFSVPAKNFRDASFNLTAPSSNSAGAFTYTSSNTAVASVTIDGIVTIVSAGATTITATQAAIVNGNYLTGSVTASLVVSAIAPTIGALSVPAKNFGDASFNLTAPTSDSSGTFTYTSSNTAVATVTTSGTVTVVSAGSTTITATQAASADGNYTGGSSVSASLVVSPITPSIGALSVPAKNFRDASFNLSAPTSDSSGAFTYTSSNTAVATVTSDGRVTVVGAGTATITATQAASADGNYEGGSSVSASLVVSPIAPTIGALSVPAKNFGDASFNLTAPTTDSSGAFTYTSSNTSVATVALVGGVGVVTVVGAGTTTITATQAASADGNYTGGSSVSASLVVSAIAPTIGALSISGKNFGVSPFNLTAPTSNSSGSFSYTSSNTAVATVALVSGVGVVTVVGAGTTTITATQAASADGNYTGGSAVTASLVVSPIAPTIGALGMSDKNVNDPSFNLTAPTSSSNGAFTYTSSNSAVATVSNVGGVGTVTLVGVGSTTITATQAASTNGNYTGGSSVTAILTVTAELSNFTVPSDKKYGDASFNLTDPTSIYSGEPFTFSSSDTTVASIGGADGRTVTIHKVGSTIITATQAATGAHGEVSISATLVVSKKTPVITVAASSIAKNYGDATFNIALPSSTNTDAVGGGGDGGGGGVFSYSSRNASIVSITDTSYVSITGVGSTVVDVTQSATANFTEAVSTISITISKGTPVLSAFTVSANKTYGSAPFSALAYPSSASAGAFTYSSSDNSVATINSSGIITLLAAGYVNFTATQASTALYNSAAKTSNTMTVHRQLLPLIRSSPSSEVINKTYGVDGNFSVIATNASNGGTITYETDNPSVAGIVGLATAGIISVVTVGTATITARRGDTLQYSSVPVSWTVEVGRTTTTLTGLSDVSYNVTAAPFYVSASSASDGAVSYSLQDPTSEVLTIHPTTGLVTLRAPGSAVIVASQAQGTLYLAPTSITATITVSSAGNALEGATITNTSSFESVNLSGASLAGVTITNTTFESANLNGSNMTNAVITNANFANADLSGVRLTGASITGATFTAVTLNNADLSGAVVTNTVFTGADLSGAILTRVDASGASFANASLGNVDLTGANITNTNFTNTNIKGANITDVSFSDVQKLQLLKNSENREIPQVIVTEVPGTTVLAVVSESSPLRSVANLNLANSTLKVIIPQTSPSPVTLIQNIEIDVAGSTRFYLPINESEYFQIQDIKYYASAGVVRNYTTNAVVEVIYYSGTPIWLFAGSIVGLILQANTLNSASFVVPRIVTLTTAPFMPTTLPTSNSNAPIVYSSSNPAVATIDASSGLITVVGNQTGEVVFTASQTQNVTHEPGVSVSNRMTVSTVLNFSLIGLNQAFNLSTLATLDASSVNLDATDATAIFYVRLSDMLNVFKYQSDAFDVDNLSAQDIKYYVFHRNWPSELRINPSHAMMNQLDSVNMLGSGFSADKSLTKHDFIRHIALALFNTIHGVDLFSNEEDLMENSVYLGETVRHNIDGILSDISTTSSSEAMAYDASGNKYLTNDASGNTNLCRELMRQVAASSPLRFYNNGGDNAGIKTVPFLENDTIQFKLVMQAAIQQNLLTGVSEIPSRSYTIKLILKNTVNAFSNTNTMIRDSEMYPNSFPYSTSVTTYAPTADSSGVYNIYSPPAPIPFARYGYNGWYYTNSTAWVNVEPAVRNHVKWLVDANTGSSKVGDLQYIRFNLKIHNKTALPYLMIYTDAGSSRKYPVVGGSASLTNGGVYSLYMNFNSYGREPAVIGHTNAALAYTVGSGSFANTEGILNIALETDSNAAAGSVEFTLMSIVVGELSTTTGATTEKEYGFQAAVLDSYP